MNYKIKKGVNIWSLEPEKSISHNMKTAVDAGFDGIELAFNLTGEMSFESTDEDVLSYVAAAKEMGIEIGSLASALFWKYSLTSNYENSRKKAKAIIRKMVDFAALLEVDTILVVPGKVGIDINPENPEEKSMVFYEDAYNRAFESLKELAPYAENKGIYICIENVWNKFLLSPIEVRDFISKIDSPCVAVYLDVGNIQYTGYAEHWIRALGSKIKCLHFKDFKDSTGNSEGFTYLLQGNVNYKGILDELEKIEYSGWAFAEIPAFESDVALSAKIYSISMDSILGR